VLVTARPPVAARFPRRDVCAVAVTPASLSSRPSS